MSEQERETELVAGTIGGITQKKADTWTVAVTPDGSQYAKNLWTKDVDLVESLSTKIGQAGAFVCGVSEWTRDGKTVRSLWINALTDGTLPEAANPTSSVATPASAPQAAAPQAQSKSGGEQLSKDEWARKDSAAWKRMLIESAADALKHTIPSDPTREDLNKFVERTFILTYAWHSSVIAERDDPTGEAVPFD